MAKMPQNPLNQALMQLLPALRNTILKLNKMTANPRPLNFQKSNNVKPFKFPKTKEIQNPFNQLRKVFSNISSSILAKRSTEKDYTDILRGFMPAGADFVKPKLPLDAGNYFFEDLDGDFQKELISSYRTSHGINTLILRKEGKDWFKVDEIQNHGYDGLEYCGAHDIRGEGGKQLMLGLNSKGSGRSLHGYFLDNKASKFVEKSYNRLHFYKSSRESNPIGRTKLAVWNKNSDRSYNIEMLQWNGTSFDTLPHDSQYFSRNVIPYHASRIKQNPYSAASWYDLANALSLGGAKSESREAVKIGMSVDKDSEFKQKFQRLIDSL